METREGTHCPLVDVREEHTLIREAVEVRSIRDRVYPALTLPLHLIADEQQDVWAHAGVR
jgi:hypothetical protein